MKIALLSVKGQITIPRQIQKDLGVGHGSRLAIYPQKNVIIIKPLKTSITDQTAGSLANLIPLNKKGVPFGKVRQQTQQTAAYELATK